MGVGISATHLVPMTIKLNGNTSDIALAMVSQYYLNASYTSEVGKSLAIRPSINLKSDGDNLQAEADLLVIFNNFFWVGGGLRGYNDNTLDGFIATAGMNIGNNFRVGYSYDYTLSSLSNVSNGSHEVVLNYRVNLIKPAKPGKAIYNPRF